MGRIRTIKPEFPQSESIGRLSRDARLLFIQLWTIVDDSGRSRAASRMLASLLFPYDDDAPRLIDGWIAELELEGIVRLYEIDGSTYLEIVNWLKHQKVDHPTPSKLPAYEEKFAKPRENSRNLAPDLGPRTKDLIENLTILSSTNGSLTCESGNGKAKPKREISADKRDLIIAVADAWNDLAASYRLAQIDDITRKRQSAILARAKDLVSTYGFTNAHAGFQELFQRIRGSPFLRGEVNGFRATFDFATTQSSFTKIMEGTYAANETHHRR